MREPDLSCIQCGTIYKFALLGACSCGGTLFVRYDLDAISKLWTPDAFAARPHTMWRYRELLPVRDAGCIVSLGEGWTALTELHARQHKLNVRRIRIKREGYNPTGSFKARGMSCAVSLLREWGVERAVLASNGNAAAALAAYAAKTNISATVFLPGDCPNATIRDCRQYGAEVFVVAGWIHDAGAAAQRYCDQHGGFNLGTLREPGRVEGKKTMGFEIAEQSGWKLPDAIVYPTGGGSGLIGMWKAFQELREMGLVEGDMPRLYCVQITGCDPIVHALADDHGLRAFEPDTRVSHTGVRVPYPPNADLLVNILRDTGGSATRVDELEVAAALQQLQAWNILCSHEGGAAWAGLLRLYETGVLNARDDVVVFQTAQKTL